VGVLAALAVDIGVRVTGVTLDLSIRTVHLDTMFEKKARHTLLLQSLADLCGPVALFRPGSEKTLGRTNNSKKSGTRTSFRRRLHENLATAGAGVDMSVGDVDL
jgi:hypothetical protein